MFFEKQLFVYNFTTKMPNWCKNKYQEDKQKIMDKLIQTIVYNFVYMCVDYIVDTILQS